MARVTMTTFGFERLKLQYERRVNFLGGEGMRSHLQEMGKAIKEQYLLNAQRFTPGPVADLSRPYKKRKIQEVGYAYPILWKTGAMLSSLYSRIFKLAKGKWEIRVRFAGKHPGGGISNNDLARIHVEGAGSNPPRDFTKLPEGFVERWNRKLLSRMRRGR